MAFLVAAKHDLIEPCDYRFIDNNRLTNELFNEWRLESDWKRIKGPKRVYRVMEDAEKKAHNIVEQHWLSIELIAEELLKRQILHELEIRAILAANGRRLPIPQ